MSDRGGGVKIPERTVRVLCGIVVVVVVLGAAAVAADRVEAHTVDGNAPAVVQGGSPTSRADELDGTPQADTLAGKAGHDTIDGGAGPDTIDGGPGRDFVLGGGGNDTIDARDGYVDAVHCGNGRDTVTADEKDAVSETCEDVSPPPEDDRTATLAVRWEEGPGPVSVPEGYYPAIGIDLRTWLPNVPRGRPEYCLPPSCVYAGSARPPNEVSFFKASAPIGPGFPEPLKYGLLAVGDCWRHQGRNEFAGSCTLHMDSDKVVLIQYWPCKEIPPSRRSDACAD